MRLIAALALTLALPLFGQSQTNVAQPQYPPFLLAAGAGYVQHATQPTEGWIASAIELAPGSPYYASITLDLYGRASTSRLGLERIVYRSPAGRWYAYLRADGGATTAAPVIGSFAGGGGVLWQFRPSWYLLGEVRIVGITATTQALPASVTTGLYFGIGRSF